jgi:hypothetical protein
MSNRHFCVRHFAFCEFFSGPDGRKDGRKPPRFLAFSDGWSSDGFSIRQRKKALTQKKTEGGFSSLMEEG